MLGYKNSSFAYASLINSGLFVFFRLIFDQEVYILGCANFMAWYFLGLFSRISDGHSYPFYPEVPPRRKITMKLATSGKSFSKLQNEWQITLKNTRVLIFFIVIYSVMYDEIYV